MGSGGGERGRDGLSIQCCRVSSWCPGTCPFSTLLGELPWGPRYATVQYTMSYSTLLHVQVQIQVQGQQSTLFKAQPSKGTPGIWALRQQVHPCFIRMGDTEAHTTDKTIDIPWHSREQHDASKQGMVGIIRPPNDSTANCSDILLHSKTDDWIHQSSGSSVTWAWLSEMVL